MSETDGKSFPNGDPEKEERQSPQSQKPHETMPEIVVADEPPTVMIDSDGDDDDNDDDSIPPAAFPRSENDDSSGNRNAVAVDADMGGGGGVPSSQGGASQSVEPQSRPAAPVASQLTEIEADQQSDQLEDDLHLTTLPSPTFEKTFRAQILRPLFNILSNGSPNQNDGGNENSSSAEPADEIVLREIRCAMRGVMRAVYTTASCLYDPSSKRRLSSAPSFADETAEQVARTKLLPQAIRNMLRIGFAPNNNNNRGNYGGYHSNRGGGCSRKALSANAEEDAACVLLDFVELSAAILSLQPQISSETKNKKEDESCDTKRMECDDNGDKDSSNNALNLLNPLDYLGQDFIEVLRATLAWDACSCAYQQERRRRSQEIYDQNQQNRHEERKLQTLVSPLLAALPPFYQAYIGRPVTPVGSPQKQQVKEGENKIDLDVDRQGSYRKCKNRREDLLSFVNAASNHAFRVEDGAAAVVEGLVSGHLLSACRVFVEKGGVEGMARCVLAGVPPHTDEDNDDYKKTGLAASGSSPKSQIDAMSIQRASVPAFHYGLNAVRSVAYLHSFIISFVAVANLRESQDSSCAGTATRILRPVHPMMLLYRPFLHAYIQYLSTIQVGIDVKSAEERRVLLRTVESVCERADVSGIPGYANGNKAADRPSSSSDPLFDTLVDVTSLEANDLRIDVLWKLLRGSNTTLQSQILGLNELRAWMDEVEREHDEAGRVWENLRCAEETANIESGAEDDTRNGGESVNENSSRRSGGEGLGGKTGVGSAVMSTHQLPPLKVPAVAVPPGGTGAEGVRQCDEDGADENSSTGAACYSNATSHSSCASSRGCSPAHLSNEDVNEGSEVCFESHGGGVNLIGMEKEKNRVCVDLVATAETNGVDGKGSNTSDNDAPAATISGNSGADSEQRQEHQVLNRQQSSLHSSPENDRYQTAQFHLHQLIDYVTSPRYPLLPHLLSAQSLHPELLKRTSPLLQFLAVHGALTERHLELLWDAASIGGGGNGKNGSGGDGSGGGSSSSNVQHESVTSAVLDLICGLLDGGKDLLNGEHLGFLANLLKQVDAGRWTIQSLGIVERVVQRSLDSLLLEDVSFLVLDGRVEDHKVRHPHGLDLLWNLAQESVALSRREIHDAAVQSLLFVTERVISEAARAPLSCGRSGAKVDSMTNPKRDDFVGPMLPEVARTPQEITTKMRVRIMWSIQSWLLMNAIESLQGKCDTGTMTSIKILSIAMHILPPRGLGIENGFASLSNHQQSSSIQQQKIICSLEDLMSVYDLPSILISDIARYTERSAQKHLSLLNSSERNDLDNTITVGRYYTHLECIKSRLEALKLMVQCSVTICVKESELMISNEAQKTNEGSYIVGSAENVAPNDNTPRCRQHRGGTNRPYDLASEGESAAVGAPSINPAIVVEDEDENDVSSANKLESSVSLPCHEQNATKFDGKLRMSAHSMLPVECSPQFSRLLPTPRHISSLWNNFILKGLTQESLNFTLETLRYLLRLCPKALREASLNLSQRQEYDLNAQHKPLLQQWDFWKDELIRCLFPLCESLPRTTLHQAGYDLFIYCLGRVNVLEGHFKLGQIPRNGNITERQLSMNKRMSKILLGMHNDYVGNMIGCMAPGVVENSDRGDLVAICNYDVQGLSTLWSIVAETLDEKVCQLAMFYLSTLYTYPYTEDIMLMAANQRDFVRKCVGFLREEKNENKRGRILKLIRIFTEFVLVANAGTADGNSDQYPLSLSHGFTTTTPPSISTSFSHSNDSQSPSSFAVRVQPIGGVKFSVPCPHGALTTVAHLRQSIKDQLDDNKSHQLDASSDSQTGTSSKEANIQTGPADYRLLYKGKEITCPGADTLASVDIEHNTIIHCCPRLSTSGYKKNVAKNALRLKSVGNGNDPMVIIDETEDGTVNSGDHGKENVAQPGGWRAASSLANSIKHVKDQDQVYPGNSFQTGSFLDRPSMSGIRELLTPQHMNQFFQLLSFSNTGLSNESNATMESVWEILQLLPTDPRLKEALSTLSAVDERDRCAGAINWDLLLPRPPTESSPSSSFRLLYSLQLVESLALQCSLKQGVETRQRSKQTRSQKPHLLARNVVLESESSGTGTKAKKKSCSTANPASVADRREDGSVLAKSHHSGGAAKQGGRVMIVDCDEGEREKPLKKHCANSSPLVEYVPCRDGSADATDINGDSSRLSTGSEKGTSSPFNNKKGLGKNGPRLSWCANFHIQGGLAHLIQLLLRIDLSMFVSERDEFDFSHRQDKKRQAQKQIVPVTMDALILLKCAARLLRLVRFFVEKSDSSTNIHTAGTKTLFGPLLRHLLKLVHWSVALQQPDTVTQTDRRNVRSVNEASPGLDCFASCTSDTKGQRSPGTSGESWNTTSQHAFSGEECTLMPCQCLMLMKLILGTAAKNDGEETGIDQGAYSSCLLEYLHDDTNHTVAGRKIISDKDISPSGGQPPVRLLTNAVASVLVKSSSEKVRCTSMMTLRSLFSTTKNEQPDPGESVRVSHDLLDICDNPPDSEVADLKPNGVAESMECELVPSNLTSSKIMEATEGELISVLITLLPLGQNVELMSQCSNLFDILLDLLSHLWERSTDAERSSAVKQAMSDSDSAKSGGSSPPVFCGVQSLGTLFYWIIYEIWLLPNRERREPASSAHKEQHQQKHQQQEYIVDQYLVGLLKLATRIIEVLNSTELKALIGCLPHPSSSATGFLNLLFTKCAFAIPDDNGNQFTSSTKILSPQTQDATRCLLLSLCQDCLQNAKILCNLLLAHHHNFTASAPRQDIIYEWSFDPLSRQKSLTGYVGMKNQGATCYLNSLLQQFFLIPPFRQGVLSCDPYLSTQDSSESKDMDINDNLLYQLQLLFTNLLLSDRRDYDTFGLVASIKGYDGEPIRPGEQQDVGEFFSLFCDRLETLLKPLPQRRLLQDVFGGKLCHMITCQECKNTSERYEDCLAVSLDVKGKASILESLDLYIQGEALDGANQYYCNNCRAKQDSIKMCCIGSLPNTLVVHLKRFEFDLELMRKIKVNDRCEFPTALNMLPYTKEGIASTGGPPAKPDGYYNYSLRGVLVHTGTADSGHYYSLAKRRASDVGGSEKSDNETSVADDESWFCFNDSSVIPFDPSTLPEASFGGTKSGEKYDNLTQQFQPTETPKVYSAYMLIYERDHIEYLEDTNSNEEQSSLEGGQEETPKEKTGDHSKNVISLRHSSQTLRRVYSDLRQDSREAISPNIYAKVWKENRRFLQDQIFFSPGYSNWLFNLAKVLSDMLIGQPLLEMIKVLTHHLFENLIHAKDKNNLVDTYASILCIWYSQNAEACLWLLQILCEKYKCWTETILLHCPVVEVRRNFLRVITDVFRTLTSNSKERDLYAIEEPTSSIGAEGSAAMLTLSSDNDHEEIRDADDEIVQTKFSRSGSSLKVRTVKRTGRARFILSKSLLARFVGVGLLDLLEDCESHWRRFDQLFDCIAAFALCGHEESMYLIRCGLVLRLVDVYLGDGGGVRVGSLVVGNRGKRSSRKNSGGHRRPKMGDKYSKPNFFPLLHLLSVLARSVVIMPDEDDSDSDSEDSEEDNSKRKIQKHAAGNSNIFFPPTLYPYAVRTFESSLCRMEMPRRDAALLSTKKFLQTLFDEVPRANGQSATNSSSSSTLVSSNSTVHQIPSSTVNTSTMVSLVKDLVSHICYDNIESSKMVCNVTQRMLEDRKADEFLIALEAVLSLLRINDSHIFERTNDVMSAICSGMSSNLKYEKETVVILDGIKTLLTNRTKGKRGLPSDVLLHNWMVKNLKRQIIDVWFRRPNTSSEVRQSLIVLIKCLLPSPEETQECVIELGGEEKDAPVAPGAKKRSGSETNDFAVSPKRQRRHNSENKEVVQIDTPSKEKSLALPPPSPLLPSRHFQENIGSQHGENGQEDVVVLGVMKKSQGEMIVEKSKEKSVQVKAPTSNLSDADRNVFQPPSLVDYYDSCVLKERILKCLIDIFPEISDALRSQASLASGKGLRSAQLGGNIPGHGGYDVNNGHIVDSTAFAEYFTILQQCLSGSDNEKHLILSGRYHGIHKDLICLLWKIDEEGRHNDRPSADVAKGTLVLFYEHLVKIHPEVGDELTNNFVYAASSNEMEINDNEKSPSGGGENSCGDYSDGVDLDKERKQQNGRNRNAIKRRRVDKKRDHKPKDSDDASGEIDHVTKLLEVYVTSARGNEAYNNKYMSHYYKLLLLLASRHPSFRRRMLAHDNWRWSLRAFVLGPTSRMSGQLYDVIFHGTKTYLGKDAEFRRVLLLHLIAPQTCDGGKRSFLSQSKLDTASVSLLHTIFDSERNIAGEEDSAINVFVDDEHRGMSHLSASIIKFHNRLDDDGGAGMKAGVPTIVVLKGLSLSLECLCMALSSLGLNQMRSIMAEWPEVDDILSLCTQIVSRTGTEWNKSLGDKGVEEGNLEAMRIASHATEVCSIMASEEKSR